MRTKREIQSTKALVHSQTLLNATNKKGNLKKFEHKSSQMNEREAHKIESRYRWRMENLRIALAYINALALLPDYNNNTNN